MYTSINQTPQNLDPARVSEERKKRNYADFWTPVAANEPFRVLLSALRDKCGARVGGGAGQRGAC